MKIKNNVVKNKLLTLKVLKLNIYKTKCTFVGNLNKIKLNLKHVIQVVYKYKINRKQILIINALNNIIFRKLCLIKFVLLYWNKTLLKNSRLFLKNHLILILNKQSHFYSLYKINFIWIPFIFLKNSLYWYTSSNLKTIWVFKRYKKIIVRNFLLLLLNINEFKKIKN